MFFEQKQEVAKAGFEVGPSYDEYELTLKARQAMMRNATDKVCDLCCLDSQDMDRARKSGSSIERLSKLASGLVVDALLDCTSRLLMQDVAKHPSKCAAKETLLLLRSSVLRYSEKSEFAVPEEIVKDVDRAAVVDPEMPSAAHYFQFLKSWGPRGGLRRTFSAALSSRSSSARARRA